MNFEGVFFHPLMVHFPIALCFFEFFLLALAAFKKDIAYLQFARLTFYVLTAGLAAALISGYHDAGGHIADLFAGGVKPHFFAACSLTALTAVRFVLWRQFSPSHPRCVVVHLCGSVLMMAAVSITAYFGGELVYS